ncbi:MAG: tRNA pseudouridine synthase B [Pelotomaculum thermopropionicum]|uniref:tRNA pseudouridine synthase B n=1 Tax=Pelotomaculum thermopropionicum TaxID=110500 RepID=A0A124FZE8_9FIRM|nr:MAG: tRNA pseudouridine synthase B [Pelotomaculum thermopropionicum]
MNGFVNVLKPPGMSSHDIVNYLRRMFGIKKVGHTGTLDPGAAGVLIVCLGTATRLARLLVENDKEYRTEITFGLSTTSGDSFGDCAFEGDASHLDEHKIRAILPLFTGRIEQVPPMTSALKVQGKKLYELARSGRVIERPARTINIFKLEFIWGTGWGGPHPRALLHMVCSKGTYVRSVCTDIGKYLGCGAHMSFLVRTRVGVFEISGSKTLEQLRSAADGGKLGNEVVTVEEVFSELPAVTVKSGAVPAVLSGSKLYLPGVMRMPEGLSEGTTVRLIRPGKLLAVAVTAVDPENTERMLFKPVWVI